MQKEAQRYQNDSDYRETMDKAAAEEEAILFKIFE